MDNKEWFSLEELTDEIIGKKGTPDRKEFDAEVESALIGATIKEARKAQHLTQTQLGERVGVQAAQISKIENGRNLTITTIVKVLRALGHTAEFTISGSVCKPVILGA